MAFSQLDRCKIMDAASDDTHVLDRFALHFAHGGFDLPTDLSQNHHGTNSDYMTGGDSLSLDHHPTYFNDPNLAASNLLDVSQSAMYDSSFASINLTGADNIGDLVDGGNVHQITASSVVDTVASGGIDSSMNESKLFEMDQRNLSSSTSPNDEKKSCTCKDCGKVFNSVWYLKQHAVKHSSDRPFKCKYCHKTYRFRSNLYQHKCPLRDRASELATVAMANGKNGVDAPRKLSSSTTTDSPHASSESSSAADVASSTAGVTRTRKRRVWPPLTSPTPSSMVNGAEKSNFKAKMRKGNQFDDGNALFNGLRGGNGVNLTSSMDSPSPLAQQEANSGATTKPSNSPMRTMSEEEVQKFLERHKDKLHKCPKCKSLWPSREYLTRHTEWHNDDSSRFRCVQCSETFVDEHRYGLHKQNHSPASLHVCARCRGKFSTRVALKKHARRCSLADANSQNGSLGAGHPVKAAVAIGFRQALFIDQTPPPSPRAGHPPSSDSRDSTEGNRTASTPGSADATDSVQTAAQSTVSPLSSISENGVQGGKSNQEANGRGEVGGAIDGDDQSTNSNTPFGSVVNEVDSKIVPFAFVQASPFGGNFGKTDQGALIVPHFDVPGSNLNLIDEFRHRIVSNGVNVHSGSINYQRIGCYSAQDGCDQFFDQRGSYRGIHSGINGGQLSMDDRIIGSDQWRMDHNQTQHNSRRAGEFNFDPQVQIDTPYFYHAESSRMETTKSILMTESESAIIDHRSSIGFETTALLENLIMHDNGSMHLEDQESMEKSISIDIDFGDVGKSIPERSKIQIPPDFLSIEIGRRHQQYSKSNQSVVPSDTKREEEAVAEEKESASVSATKLIENPSSAIACIRIARSEKNRQKPHCFKCKRDFSDWKKFRNHWISRHSWRMQRRTKINWRKYKKVSAKKSASPASSRIRLPKLAEVQAQESLARMESDAQV